MQQRLLNQLVRKHLSVGAIYPMRIGDALSRRLFTPGQFEIVTTLLEPSTKLADESIRAVEPIASRGLILALGERVEDRPTRRVSEAS